jgi:hypothetical protein
MAFRMFEHIGGAKGDRTLDLMTASHYQRPPRAKSFLSSEKKIHERLAKITENVRLSLKCRDLLFL